jgi:hypothetical protein
MPRSGDLTKTWLPVSAVVACVAVALLVGVRMQELSATSALARENANAIRSLELETSRENQQLEEIIRRLDRIERRQEAQP